MGKSMTKNMTEGVPVKLILGFAAPMLIGNIFQQIYNLVDAAIVGKFVGEEALASVGAAGSTTFLLFSLIMGLCNGAAIIISQFFGNQNIDKMKEAVVSLAQIAVLLGIIVSCVGMIVATPILKLLNTPEDILHDSATYVRIIFGGVLATAIYNACSAILRSIGDSKTPLYSLIASSITNVILDLVFVIGLGLGVAGVAYATIIAQIVSCVVCIICIIKKHEILHISKEKWKLYPCMIKQIFRMGIPTALQSSLISLGGLSVQSLINSFGASTIAAYTAANKIDTIAIQFVVSIGTSMATFTGQNVGAGKIDRIKLALKQVLVVMVIACILIAVTILSLRGQLLSLFLDSTEAKEAIIIGSEYLSIVVVAYIIAGVMQSFLNVIRGAGDVNASMLAGIVELTARIVFAYLLSSFLGTTGIWLATPLSWGTACLFTIFRYSTGQWKTKAVISK